MAGLGMRIRSLNNNFETAPMLLYIIIIGVIGIIIEKLIKYLERRLTGWQEKREI
jgi:ABC-type nitrate/sulfonate/bicarbonate transport system, permease component